MNPKGKFFLKFLVLVALVMGSMYSFLSWKDQKKYAERTTVYSGHFSTEVAEQYGGAENVPLSYLEEKVVFLEEPGEWQEAVLIRITALLLFPVSIGLLLHFRPGLFTKKRMPMEVNTGRNNRIKDCGFGLIIAGLCIFIISFWVG